jgi:Anaphase-promoting complex subunit 4 WD40 domain
MDGGDTQPHAFLLTQELALSAELAAVLWSPTMDVAAALSRDGSLQLHRMDWSPLWASAPASRITALVWRPDGRALATGHADGSLSLLDVESGEVLAQHRAHFASITSLCWAEDAADKSNATAPLRTPESGADDVANNCATTGGSALAGLGDNASLSAANHSIAPHERYKRLFVPPVLQPYAPSSTEPPPPPYALSIDTPGAPAWPASERGSSMSLLAAADARGSVSLWLRGEVQIAEVAAALHSNGSGNGGAGGADEDKTAAGSCSDGTQQDYRLLHVRHTRNTSLRLEDCHPACPCFSCFLLLLLTLPQCPSLSLSLCLHYTAIQPHTPQVMPDSQLMQLLIVHQAPSGAQLHHIRHF